MTNLPGPGYYENTRADLIPMIGASRRRILDVGCGAGKFGAALKALEPGREVHGVELVEEAALGGDEAPVVAPGRVLGMPGLARANIPGEHTGQEPFRVRTVDPVLVERRRVEYPGAVADREVFELVRHLVPVGREVARPVAPQAGLVERAGSVVEG